MTGDSLTIKKTLSVFLQKSVEEIDETTPLKISSIMKHRMFAALSEKGVQVRDSHTIRTVGDLFRKHKVLHHALDEPMTPPPPPHEALAVRAPVPVTTDGIASPLAMNIQMGVDLEDVENLPEVPDVRKDPFYTATFSQQEIAYCLLQEDPRQSFTGKFAAKEALIKIDNAYGKRPLNQIEILNTGTGKPYFKDFTISISHTKHSAVAVVILPTISPRVATDPHGYGTYQDQGGMRPHSKENQNQPPETRS